MKPTWIEDLFGWKRQARLRRPPRPSGSVRLSKKQRLAVARRGRWDLKVAKPGGYSRIWALPEFLVESCLFFYDCCQIKLINWKLCRRLMYSSKIWTLTLPALCQVRMLKDLLFAIRCFQQHQKRIARRKTSYCWWKKSCTISRVWNPANIGINYLSTGAGFLPSTVSLFPTYLFHRPTGEIDVNTESSGSAYSPDVAMIGVKKPCNHLDIFKELWFLKVIWWHVYQLDTSILHTHCNVENDSLEPKSWGFQQVLTIVEWCKQAKTYSPFFAYSSSTWIGRIL